MFKFRRFFRPIANVSGLLAIAVVVVVLFAIATHYPGLISLKWGLDGGHIMIDGRPFQE